jgi:hypothetical protein
MGAYASRKARTLLGFGDYMVGERECQFGRGAQLSRAAQEAGKRLANEGSTTAAERCRICCRFRLEGARLAGEYDVLTCAAGRGRARPGMGWRRPWATGDEPSLRPAEP